MFKKIILTFAIGLAPLISSADSNFETFFKDLEGQWHGEVPGFYQIDMSATKFDVEKPWALQSGDIKITEGDVTSYHFEISSNESALDLEKVYFLKVKNNDTQKEDVYTFAPSTSAFGAFSFWRYISDRQYGEDYLTAQAVKFFQKEGVLTLGFVAGQMYCLGQDQKVSFCGSDGYRPYEMKKTPQRGFAIKK